MQYGRSGGQDSSDSQPQAVPGALSGLQVSLALQLLSASTCATKAVSVMGSGARIGRLVTGLDLFNALTF